MLENIKPWLGHGKKRRHRRVRPRADANDPVTVPRTDTDESTTKSGRVVRKPLRYRVGYSSCPGRTASQQGGRCKERDPGVSRNRLAGKEV